MNINLNLQFELNIFVQENFCKVCGLVFKSKKYLKEHMFIHSDKHNTFRQVFYSLIQAKLYLILQSFIRFFEHIYILRQAYLTF